MRLTAVSLFAGVGGFDLAMERNGVDVVATVEIDKAARGVLQHRFPSAQHFEDVTKVSADELRAAGFVPERGIITGGFPCQDLSVAGKRAGLAGGRSGLFWEIIRLADELKPSWLVLENVPGLLSSNGGRDFGAVLGALVDLGYGVGYRTLDAQFFGVPQRRRRVFIVGRLGDDGRSPSEVLAVGEGVPGDSEKGAEARSPVAALTSTGVGTCGADDNQAQAGHLIADTVRSHPRPGSNSNGNITIARTPTARHDSSPDGDRGFNIVPFVKVIRSGARDENGDLPAEVWAERDVAPTLNAMDNTGEGRATVIAFSHNSATDIQPSEELVPTLRAQHQGGGPAIAGATVRRLTPIECERLQGFPDGWTTSRVDEKKGLIEQADSARYKQMGNAVAVPVVEWIMARLVAVESAAELKEAA